MVKLATYLFGVKGCLHPATRLSFYVDLQQSWDVAVDYITFTGLKIW